MRAKAIAGLAILIVMRCASALAQEQTTQQLPVPIGQAQTQSDDKRWQLTFDSAWSNFSTKETSPTKPGWVKSALNSLPVGMQFVGIPNDDWKVEVGVRSSYIDLHQTSSAGGDARFSGWTDTSLVGTVTYYGFNGFQPFASLATNLPTGQSLLTGPITKAPPADSDVTQIAGFGEGLNLGPTIGVNIPVMKNMLVTLSAGYTSRGHFLRAGPDSGVMGPGLGAVQDFKPGDVGTLNASVGYQSGAWSFQAAGSYSYEAVTMLDGVNFYQTGGKYTLSGAAGYAWNENWSSKLSTSYAYIGKNRYATSPTTGNFNLLQEFFDTNSGATTVVFDTTYNTGIWAIGPTASYFRREANGYDSDSDNFLSAKTKWTAGVVGQYAVTKEFSLNARAEHLWMTADVNPGPPAPFGNPPNVPKLETVGWIITIGGKVVF